MRTRQKDGERVILQGNFIFCQTISYKVLAKVKWSKKKLNIVYSELCLNWTVGDTSLVLCLDNEHILSLKLAFVNILEPQSSMNFETIPNEFHIDLVF